MKVADFDYELPESLIAHEPSAERDACRLLQVSKFFFDFTFRQLPELLSPGDILVLNDSKVIPARLFGRKNGSEIELLLHKAVQNHWLAFAKPAKKLKLGDVLSVADDFSAEVIAKHESGEVELRFSHQGEAFFNALHLHGHVPLPPYIKRSDTAEDREQYQTVYARHEGSVAAPTAGLHFTPELLETCRQKNIHITNITLHVGAGTFQPVKVEDTSQHVMHSEFAEITTHAAEAINQAKQSGGKIVAVGTTAMRTLESAADEHGQIHPFAQETDLFITPGYRFKAVDRLITNFHLPKSTLFMLVCAFSGTDRMKAAYEHAIRSGYRFYSYGDACLLDRV